MTSNPKSRGPRNRRFDKLAGQIPVVEFGIRILGKGVRVVAAVIWLETSD